MAEFLILHFSLFISLPLLLSADPISLFSLKDSNFDSNFALLGDANNRGSLINLTSGSGSGSGSSAGQLVYRSPIKLVDESSRKPVSFSTDFTFSMSSGAGDGMAFVVFPSGSAEISRLFDHQGSFGISENAVKIVGKFVAVEFDTRKDDHIGDPNGNHVGIDVGSFVSVEVIDVLPGGLVLNSGEKLHAWIDYEASSKRLEVRLSKFGDQRPSNPIISYSIDLPKMWGGREVLVGVSSSSGGSSQICRLYSWSFRVRTAPDGLHSVPLDPRVSSDEHQKKNCALTILGRLIFATGCGTLGTFFVLLFWVVFFTRNSMPVSELPMNTIDCKYEKIEVDVEKISNGSSAN